MSTFSCQPRTFSPGERVFKPAENVSSSNYRAFRWDETAGPGENAPSRPINSYVFVTLSRFSNPIAWLSWLAANLQRAF